MIYRMGSYITLAKWGGGGGGGLKVYYMQSSCMIV